MRRPGAVADYAAIVGRVEPDADLLNLRDVFGRAQESLPISFTTLRF